MDADSPSTGSPFLDLIAARRRDPAAPPDQAEGAPVEVGPAVGVGSDWRTELRARLEAEPEPELEPELELRDGPLAVAARLRRQRRAAGVEAGVEVASSGAPGRLHALHRRKTREISTGE